MHWPLVQRYEKILKDADTTFCDKVNTLENVRHNNKTESNVPLLELLKFNKVRQIFLLIFIKSQSKQVQANLDTKGQKILKAIYGVLNSPKTRTKIIILRTHIT